ncbi:MAG: tRNA lysidine(34) synthetase TilS, partial [Firmicutes bacterium]|nr:tRNA lysidine(34) synthetase TilS [Bacillota bacterium]
KSDCDFLKEFCQRNGIGFCVLDIDIGAMAAKNKTGLEQEGRAARHGFFKEFSDKFNAVVMLGHNCQDQAETVLMHILRGCGLDGLVGMSEQDGHLVRPLIGIDKQEILDYAADKDIKFITDQTNFDTGFARNFVREFLVSCNQFHYPAAQKNIANMADKMRQLQSGINDRLDLSLILDTKDAVMLDKKVLTDDLFSFYCLKAAKKAGLSADLEGKHIDKIKDLNTGKSIDLPKGIVVHSEKNHFAFCQKSDKKTVTGKELKMGLNKIGDCEFFVEAVDTFDKSDKGALYADCDVLLNSAVRFRQDGDRFCPCGSKTKKLKKYLCDLGLPNRKKSALPLIVSGDQILMVVGVEVSDKAKVTLDTKKILKVVCYEKN